MLAYSWKIKFAVGDRIDDIREKGLEKWWFKRFGSDCTVHLGEILIFFLILKKNQMCGSYVLLEYHEL